MGTPSISRFGSVPAVGSCDRDRGEAAVWPAASAFAFVYLRRFPAIFLNASLHSTIIMKKCEREWGETENSYVPVPQRNSQRCAFGLFLRRFRGDRPLGLHARWQAGARSHKLHNLPTSGDASAIFDESASRRRGSNTYPTVYRIVSHVFEEKGNV